MEIKDIPREGFASRRASQQQGQLAVGLGMFGEVVIYQERMFAAIAIIFAHGDAGIGRDVLHRGGFGRGCRNDGRVFHGAVFPQGFIHFHDGRLFLADGHIEALHVATALVQNGVNRQ